MGTSEEDEKERFLALFEAFNARDWDAYNDLLATDVVVHEGDKRRRGIDSIMELNQDFTTAYPDATITVDDIFTAGDRFAARINITGTTAADSSAEEDLDLAGITHGRVESGQIAEIWMLTD